MKLRGIQESLNFLRLLLTTQKLEPLKAVGARINDTNSIPAGGWSWQRAMRKPSVGKPAWRQTGIAMTCPDSYRGFVSFLSRKKKDRKGPF